MRRPKRQVNPKQIIEDSYKEPDKPAYLIIQEAMLGMLGGSTDGFTFKQLYQMMPNIDPRRVREAIQTLEAKKTVHHEKCRCGAASVYYKS